MIATNGTKRQAPTPRAGRDVLSETTIKYYPFIRKVAKRMVQRLPSHVSLDDMISAGMLGLIDSLAKYDPRKSERFEAYAEFRIKGAMLDELRAADHLTRAQRACVNAMRNAHRSLEAKLQREPEPQELAAELGYNLEQYYRVMARVGSVKTVSLEEALTSTESPPGTKESPPGISYSGERYEVRTLILGMMHQLPSKMRLLISLYYFEDFSLREISRIFNVSESRVCQLHRQAVGRLKGMLGS